MIALAVLTATAVGLAAPAAPAPPAKVEVAAPQRPVLRFGANGPQVAVVQRRLTDLKYAPGPADGVFGRDLLSAVWTFQKVNRLPRAKKVDAAMWRALAHPRRLKPLEAHGGRARVEVRLKRQLLTVYRRNKPVLITRISSGSGSAYCHHGRCGVAVTPRGKFRVIRRSNGWHTGWLGAMYRPMYFHGGFALHGSTKVPHRPASHGCVRIPLYQSDLAWRLIRTGTRVYVR